MIQELREQVESKLEAAKVIADLETRTAEQDQEFDNLMNEVDELQAKIKKNDLRDQLNKRESAAKSVQSRTAPHVIVRSGQTPTARDAMNAWCRGGNGCTRLMIESADAYEIDPTNDRLDTRALQKGTDSEGGYSVPTFYGSEYEKKLAYYFNVLQAVSSFNTPTGADFKWPKITDSGNAAAIVAEEGTIGSSTDPVFDAPITFKAWDYFSPIVIVANQLLRDSQIDVASLLMNDLFPERHGRAMQAAVVSTNAGSSAPQGFMASAFLQTGVNLSGSTITLSKLIDLEVSVDIAYRSLPGTAFLMHDATWAAIRKLASDDNIPIVQHDVQSGVAPRLLGYPVYISNSVTSIASATDNSVHILFGHWPSYKVRFVGSPVLTRLSELYAVTGQTGFALSQAWDGRYVGHQGCVKSLNAEDTP